MTKNKKLRFNKKIIFSLCFLQATAIPAVLIACHSIKPPEEYIKDIKKQGILRTTVNLPYEAKPFVFVSTFLFRRADRHYFITKTNKELIDVLRKTPVNINFRTPINFVDQPRSYDLSSRERVIVDNANADIMIFSVGKLNANPNAVFKQVSSTDFNGTNIYTYQQFEKPKPIYLYGYIPLDANDIKQFNEKYDPNVFLNGNKGSSVTSQQGNLIRIKNQGEIDERYLGAPLIYQNKLIGLLVGFEVEKDKTTNQIHNISTFHLFSVSDIKLINQVLINY